MINGTSSRRGAVAALALAAAVGLAACATPRPTAVPSAPAASPAPAVPPGFTPGPVHTSRLPENPLAVDTSAAAHGPYLPWRLVGVDATRNRITISAESAGCLAPRRVHLDETASEIRITFEAVGSTDASARCTAQMLIMVGWVSPREPIGTRRIVHGPSS